jgi:hypothetical protein
MNGEIGLIELMSSEEIGLIDRKKRTVSLLYPNLEQPNELPTLYQHWMILSIRFKVDFKANFKVKDQEKHKEYFALSSQKI